jgi:predicted dehydrogenase
MEAMWTRFMPAMVEAKRIVDSGEIGKPANVSADFGFTANAGPEHRLFAPELGGGALLDLGIYPLSMASFFLGPSRRAGAGGDDRHRRRYADRVHAVARAGRRLGLRLQPAFAHADRADHLRHQGLSAPARPLPQHRRSPWTWWMAAAAASAPSIAEEGNGYTHEAQEVGRCLRAGLIESPVMPHEETLAIMGTLDEIRRQIGLVYSADSAN